MKTALFVICVLCTSTAFGQLALSSISAQPTVYTFDSHPEHASRQPMAQEQNLNGGVTLTYGQGERPLWEVAAPVRETPLGDSARMLRQEHATARKAARCWQNY
jgi:hypothetical protein